MGVPKDKIPRGEKRFAAKLTEDNVREMRRMRKQGMEYTKIAVKFGVSMSTAKSAIDGQTWKHVGTAIRMKREGEKTKKKNYVYARPTPEMISMGKEMLEAAVKGATIAQLKDKYGISDVCIYRHMNTYRAYRDGEITCPC